MDMKLGIIGAMDLEVETLLAVMDNRSESQHLGTVFHEGSLKGLSVVVVQCGVGKVNAALCTQLLCDYYHITHLVNTGVAGSLCKDLDIGDLVVSRDAMYHDVDVTFWGHAYGQVPGMDVLTFPADPDLIRYAVEAGQQVHSGHVTVGRVASGDQFICDDGVKQKIIENTQALCAEMEGAAIAHAAYRNRVPFVIIRAMADKADGSEEIDYPTFEREAAHHCAAVTCRLAQAIRASQT